MAKEKMEDLSLEKLLKRKKFFAFCLGVCLGIFLFMLGWTLYEAIKEDKFVRSSLYGITPVFFSSVIPFIFLKEINKELKRREYKK